MANVQGPFGFSELFGGSGGAPTFNQTPRRIASTNGTAIYFGDPVMPVVSTANGYITQAGGRHDGVRRHLRRLQLSLDLAEAPGVVATGPAPMQRATSIAHVIDDPNAIFLVQGSSTTFNDHRHDFGFTSSPVGQYAQFNIGTGSTATGHFRRLCRHPRNHSHLPIHRA
jgi:hypothetical protein